MYTELFMKIRTKFMTSLFPGCSVMNRRKDTLVTAGRLLMGLKTVPHPPYIPDLAPCNLVVPQAEGVVVWKTMRK